NKTIGYNPPSVSAYFGHTVFPDLGRYRAYERVVREAFLDFVRQNPIYMLRLTIITKPYLTLCLYRDAMLNIIVNGWAYLLAIGLMFIVSVRNTRLSLIAMHDLRSSTILIGGMAMTSLAPLIAAYPSGHAIGDGVALWSAFIASFVMIAFIAWWRRMRLVP
ncbi:MAG: hypothetical protein WCK65_09425, partial [Rhodospirillaceae bacterium]